MWVAWSTSPAPTNVRTAEGYASAREEFAPARRAGKVPRAKESARAEFTVDAASAPRTPPAVNQEHGEPASYSLAEVNKMTTGDLINHCRQTEYDLVQNNLDVHAGYAAGRSEAEQIRFSKWLNKSAAKTFHYSQYWTADVDVAVTGGTISFTIYTTFNLGYRQPASASESAELIPEFGGCMNHLVTGRYNNGRWFPVYSGDSCGGYRRPGNHFYLALDLYTDPEFSKYLNFVLLPIPITRDPPLEFQLANSREWTSVTNFKWRPTDEESLKSFMMRIGGEE